MLGQASRRGGGLVPLILLLCLGLVIFASPCEASANFHHSRKMLQGGWQVDLPWFSDPINVPSVEGQQQNISIQYAPAPSSSNTTGNLTQSCPMITLDLTSIEVYDPIITAPNGVIAVQCYTKDGSQFQPVSFPTNSDTVRGSAGARYQPNLPVARIGCDEAVSCRVSGSETATPTAWATIADGGCWFDYRHFTQMSYKEPLSAWTCSKPPVQYTLACVECADPSFPWDLAVALAGPPLTDSSTSVGSSFNTMMVIISVSVVSVAVVLAVAGVLLRSRRRARALDSRMSELTRMGQAAAAERMRLRNGRGAFKPPELFVVGEPVDMPPSGYTGPIVVLHCGEGEEPGEGELKDGEAAASYGSGEGETGAGMLRWPHIAIARPVVEAPEAPQEPSRQPTGTVASGASASVEPVRDVSPHVEEAVNSTEANAAPSERSGGGGEGRSGQGTRASPVR